MKWPKPFLKKGKKKTYSKKSDGQDCGDKDDDSDDREDKIFSFFFVGKDNIILPSQ